MYRTSLHFLADIKEAVSNIEEYTSDMSYEQFIADRKTRDAVVRNFEVIGEGTKNLPGELKDRYPAVAWKRVAGLRDVVAHGYFRVDYEILWGVIKDILPGFKTEIIKIVREEKKRERSSVD